ncbi:MAG: hypothetical protein SX243_21645 [Acidobacteriota bacterium]|nr:hypothetical protein [Acidobacteriota bacterium]
MKLRNALFLSLALAFVLVLAGSAAAAPVHYGTGIHLWVLHCGPYADGHSTAAYVSSSVCPNNPPAECRCTRTRHDFPYDHPYPTRIAAGNDTGNPGDVNVFLDSVAAIQCGATVEPKEEPEGTCGDPFLLQGAEEWEVEGEILEVIESLLPEIESETGVPVENVNYFFAQPLGSGEGE